MPLMENIKTDQNKLNQHIDDGIYWGELYTKAANLLFRRASRTSNPTQTQELQDRAEVMRNAAINQLYQTEETCAVSITLLLLRIREAWIDNRIAIR